MALQLNCRRCSFKTETVSNYVGHQAIHSLEINFSYVCPLCPFKSQVVGSLRSHIYHHKPVSAPQNVQTTSKCSVPNCDMSVATSKDLKLHLEEHMKNNESIICPFGSCAKSDNPASWVSRFSKVSSFRTHMSRYHKNATSEPLPEASTSSLHQPELSDFNDPSDEEEDPQPPPDEELFTSSQVSDFIAQFYLNIEGNKNLPSTTVQTISESIAQIIQFSHNIMRRVLLQELSQLGVNCEQAEKTAHVTLTSDPFFRAHTSYFKSTCLWTEHYRYNYFKQHFNFVEPVKAEVTVGQQNEEKQTLSLVKIRTSLNTQLIDPDVQKEVDIFLQNQASGFFHKEQNSNKVYQDFTDGSVFLEHPASKQPSLLLFLSCDAFGTTNPLGAVKNKYKTNGLYYVLGNLPPEKRSKVNILQLCALFLEKLLKVDPNNKGASEEKRLRWDQCLSPVIEELDDLCENGIEYKGQKLPVYVLFVFGDNLGQHQIGGFVETFSGDFWCRYCDITSQEFQSNPCLVKPLRTPEEYEGQAYVATTTGNSFMGVRFNSPLNRLKNFHVCLPALSPCIAHDLYEGVVAYDMMLHIRYFIKQKWFTRQAFNAKLSAFKFAGSDAADKPYSIELNKKKQMKSRLSGSAVRNWNMLRFFSLILDDLVKDTEDPVWKNYLRLKTINEYAAAPQICEKDNVKLDHLAADYLTKRKELFPNDKLKPKHHFLAHLSFLIRLLGPLLFHFTLRMESLHREMKEAARACNNFIDVTYTMAHKSQLKKAHLSLGRIFGDQFKYKTPRHFVPNWPDDVRTYIETNELAKNTVSVNSVFVHDTEYKSGMWLLLECNEEQLMVGQIIAVFCGKDFVLLVRKHTSNAESDEMGLHVVDEISDGLCHLSSMKKIASFYPLHGYTRNGKVCLTLKHRPRIN